MEYPKLERFKIIKHLGEGSMGMVYLAHDLLLDRNVALKQLDPEQLTTKMRQTRFFREARILSKLDHPHICRIYDLISSGGSDYLVLEFLQGQSLKEMDWKAIPVHQKWEILHEIAQALECAHAQKIVHRDLKPENIMITNQGVKVLDFGLSRSSEEQRALIESYSGENSLKRKINNPEKTERGAFIGTLFYMSPEQARTEQATIQSDIYSFGVIVHELLTGKKPYPPGLNIENLIRTVAYGKVGILDLPSGTRGLVESMLAVNPHKRPSASELVEWIDPQKKAFQLRRKKRSIAMFSFFFILMAWWIWFRPKPPEENILILWQTTNFEEGLALEANAILLEKFLVGSSDISPYLAPLQMKSSEQLAELLEPTPHFDSVVLLERESGGGQVLTRTFNSGEKKALAEITKQSIGENILDWKSHWPFNKTAEIGTAQELHSIGCVMLGQADYGRARLYFEGAEKLDSNWAANRFGSLLALALERNAPVFEETFLKEFNGRSLEHYQVLEYLLSGLAEKDPSLGYRTLQMLPIGHCEKNHLKVRLCLLASEIFFKVGNHQAAVAKSSQALEYAEEIGHPFYIAAVNRKLAEQHRAMDLLGRAENFQIQVDTFVKELPEVLQPIFQSPEFARHRAVQLD